MHGVLYNACILAHGTRLRPVSSYAHGAAAFFGSRACACLELPAPRGAAVAHFAREERERELFSITRTGGVGVSLSIALQ